MSRAGQSDPRVSVVIPTYNRSALLGEAVESVLAQTYSNLEVVIVDDGSTDGTSEVVRRSFGDHPRIRYFYQENGGVVSAKNAGIRRARGELVGLLDDDDIWYPEKLEQQIELLNANPDAGMCFSDMLITDGGENNSRFFEGARFNGVVSIEHLVQSNFIPASTVLIRRTCLESVGLFDASVPIAEDFELSIRIVATHPVVYVDRVLSVYRRLDRPQLCDNRLVLHGSRARALQKNRDLILNSARSWANRPSRSKILDRMIRHEMAIHNGWQVKNLLLTRPTPARREVVPTLLRTIRTEPWRLKHYRRLLVIGTLGTRFAAWWYGRRARAGEVRKQRQPSSAKP